MESEDAIKVIEALQDLEELEELEDEEEKEEKRKHRFWVNPFLILREVHDLEQHLLKDILWEEGKEYQNFCRMTVDKFVAILTLIEPSIKKQDTAMRFAISPRVRLAVTLRYIATGDSYRSLEFLSRISRKTIGKFVPDVLCAIYDALHCVYMKTPTTEDEWLAIAADFEKCWDFPHTIGSIDGKHNRITAPKHSGSDFYNYKGFFSIVLLAVVDAHSRFVYVDIGGNGRASDVIMYKNSSLYEGIARGTLRIPPAKPLKGQECGTPYFFIGDDIFGLDKNLMKGFGKCSKLSIQQEIFNYRLSRARLTVEMAFGRLASRFRVFHRPIDLSLTTTDALVKACCVLHNYLSKCKVNTEPVEEQQPLPSTMTGLAPQETPGYRYASRIRDNLMHYCITDGDVPYQWKKISN